MGPSVKKNLIFCDYCGLSKDSNQIYTTKKNFAGSKIVDILHAITKCEIPATAAIKLCNMCASTLHAATGTIERATQMVDKFLNNKVKETPANSNETAKITDEVDSDTNDELPDVNASLKKPKGKQSQGKSTSKILKNGTQTENKPSAQKKGSKNKSIALSTSQTASTNDATPNKQTINDQLDDSLDNAVKLTPANNSNKKFSELDALFGSGNANVSDEGQEEDADADVKVVSRKPKIKNIAVCFTCKLCDFESVYPNPMKKHNREVHNQQRPRIFDCHKCPKSFGVLKSLQSHLLLVHGIAERKETKVNEEPPQLNKTQEVQQEDMDKTTGPQLAVLKALKPKPKALNNVLNSEYTFAIPDTNSSTPKAVVEKQALAHQCQICNVNNDSVKSLQEHMKIVHKIMPPKPFNCELCSSGFMHKATLDRHRKNKHDTNVEKPKSLPERRNTIEVESEKATENTKLKSTPKRRKTIAIEPAALKNSSSEFATEEMSKTDEIEKSAKLTTPNKSKEELTKQTEITDFMEEICNNIDLISMESMKLMQINDDFVDVELITTKSNSPQKSKSPLKKSKTLLEKKKIVESDEEQELSAPNHQEKVSVFENNKLDDSEFICMEDMMACSTQIDNIIKVSPKKAKRSSEHNNITPVDSPKNKSNGTLKKDKVKKNNVSQTSNKTDVLDSTPLPAAVNGSAKKAKKRKTIEDTYVSQDEEDSSKPMKAKSKVGKKPKMTKMDETLTDTQGTDEINTNVKPHKREMLESFAFIESDLTCQLCGKVTSSRKRLDSHTLKKHSLKCVNCKDHYPDSMQYIGHFEACDASEGFPCGIKTCTKVFTAANYLDSHLKKIHNFS